jgi:hypothetical protein
MILKIEELKRLVHKYPQYCTNPEGIVKLAIYNSIIGDDTLDDRLEQFGMMDRRLNEYRVCCAIPG